MKQKVHPRQGGRKDATRKALTSTRHSQQTQCFSSQTLSAACNNEYIYFSLSSNPAPTSHSQRTTFFPIWRKLKPSDENPGSISHGPSLPSHQRGPPLLSPHGAHCPPPVSLSPPSAAVLTSLSLSGPFPPVPRRPPSTNWLYVTVQPLPIPSHSQASGKLSLQAMSPSQPHPLLNSVHSGFSAR